MKIFLLLIYTFFAFEMVFSETTSDFSRKVGNEVKLSQQDSEILLDKIFDCLAKEVAEGRSVTISGFGRFYINEPKKKTKMEAGGSPNKILGKKQIRFKSSEHLRRKVNNYRK